MICATCTAYPSLLCFAHQEWSEIRHNRRKERPTIALIGQDVDPARTATILRNHSSTTLTVQTLALPDIVLKARLDTCIA